MSQLNILCEVLPKQNVEADAIKLAFEWYQLFSFKWKFLIMLTAFYEQPGAIRTRYNF